MPLLRQFGNAESSVRAAIENNTAFALLMSRPSAGYDSDMLIEADRLSASAFALYPCVLAYRSTRSLVLTATGRPDQALDLLSYSHYATADRMSRGHCAIARAFALYRLGRDEECRRAAAEALRFNPDNAGILDVLGVTTARRSAESRAQEPAAAA
jgi:hypothetical protein